MNYLRRSPVRFVRGCLLLVGLGSVGLFAVTPTAEEFLALVGYTQLKKEYRDLPTGRNIAVLVADGTGVPTEPWAVPQGGELAGRTVTYLPASPAPAAFLDHAKWVTWNLTGATWSQIPDVPTIVSTEVGYYWSSVVHVGTTSAPAVPAWDIENHSWSHTDAVYSVDFNRRVDWRIDRYGLVFVSAVGNGTQPMKFSPDGAYNGISVGKTNGDHPRGGTQVEVLGRRKPDLVADDDFSSNSSPKTASSAGLLLDQAKIDPALAAARDPRVIKALLMAGATKTSFSGWSQTPDRPLDAIFGAGELNVRHSYHMLVAGRQPAGNRWAAPLGWDAGATGSRRYFFEVPAGHESEFSAILTWHRTITPSADWQRLASNLADLNLRLSHANADFTVGPMVTESRSAIDNVEHVYETHLPAGRYVLEVTGALGPTYGIAWRNELTNVAAPVLTVQPVAQTVAVEQPVSFLVVATGGGELSYQWRRNGEPITDATTPWFRLPAFTEADAGDYDVEVTNPWGRAVSGVARLSLGAGDDRRLANLSVRTRIGGGAGHVIAGFVVGGAEPKPFLIRGIGPGLNELGVGDPLTEPELSLHAGPNVIASNRIWTAGDAGAVRLATSRLGAFALSEPGVDAALLAAVGPGLFTAELGSAVGATGIGLVEVYDAATAADSNLVNLSARAYVDHGEGVLIAGFVVSGTSPATVLLRGVGPALAEWSVPDRLARPRLALYAKSLELAANTGWSTSADVAEIAAAAARVGAFPLVAGSFDSALLVTLQPGSYTVHVSGSGDATGNALAEIYLVPGLE